MADQHEWMRAYSRVLEPLGWTTYEIERWALAAWEAGDADRDPVEAAEADLSYIVDDAA